MPFLIRPSRRFLVCCPVTYTAASLRGTAQFGISLTLAGASQVISRYGSGLTTDEPCRRGNKGSGSANRR